MITKVKILKQHSNPEAFGGAIKFVPARMNLEKGYDLLFIDVRIETLILKGDIPIFLN